jgi:hypothetical protein
MEGPHTHSTAALPLTTCDVHSVQPRPTKLRLCKAEPDKQMPCKLVLYCSCQQLTAHGLVPHCMPELTEHDLLGCHRQQIHHTATASTRFCTLNSAHAWQTPGRKGRSSIIFIPLPPHSCFTLPYVRTHISAAETATRANSRIG